MSESSDIWQRQIIQLEQIKRDYRQGIPLRAAEALGLFSEKQPSELQK